MDKRILKLKKNLIEEIENDLRNEENCFEKEDLIMTKKID